MTLLTGSDVMRRSYVDFRYFMSQVANVICAFEKKRLVRYEGDYAFYMKQKPYLQDQVEARYVVGVEGIKNAPVVELSEDEKKKSFGGRGPSGRKDKGVKNAKRFNDM
jgi:ATPase subunit of ABC transporter with duplicated ATPase domains